jgi:hypothetical protein
VLLLLSGFDADLLSKHEGVEVIMNLYVIVDDILI